MRKIAIETLYFAFQDTDGVLGFSLKAYDGEPENPRFLFDGVKQVVLLRRPGQMIALDALADEFLPLLARSERVRFLETPEDSSQILRQYDVVVVPMDQIILTQTTVLSEDKHHLPT